MYIVTFIQSDSNNIDSNLCSTPQEVLSKVKVFFKDSLLDGFPEWEVYLKDELGSKREDMSIGVGCYTTIHIQALNAYSREQLSLVNQQTPLAPIKPYKLTLSFKEKTEISFFASYKEAVENYIVALPESIKEGFEVFDNIEFKAEGWDLEEKHLKPFVVAGLLPDNTEVVLGRFDTNEEANFFSSLSYISVRHEEEQKILR